MQPVFNFKIEFRQNENKLNLQYTFVAGQNASRYIFSLEDGHHLRHLAQMESKDPFVLVAIFSCLLNSNRN